MTRVESWEDMAQGHATYTQQGRTVFCQTCLWAVQTTLGPFASTNRACEPARVVEWRGRETEGKESVHWATRRRSRRPCLCR